jgi:WD40 repeat protein
MRIPRRLLRRLLGFVCVLVWFSAGLVAWQERTPVARAVAVPRVADKGSLHFLSCDGRFFATTQSAAGYESLSLWETDSGAEIFKCTHQGNCAFFVSPYAGCVAEVGIQPPEDRGPDGLATIWDAPSSKIRAKLEFESQGGLSGGAFSPDGNFWAMELKGIEGWHRLLVVWDVRTGKQVTGFSQGNPDNSSPLFWEQDASPCRVGWNRSIDGQITAWESVECVKVTATADGQVRGVFPLPLVAKSYTLSLSAEGRLLGASYQGNDWMAQKVESALGIDQEDARRQDVRRVFPPKDATVVFDTKTGGRLATLPFASPFAFRADGKTLVAYSPKDDAIVLWDLPPRTKLNLLWNVPILGLALGLTAIWLLVLLRRKQREASLYREVIARPNPD